ncbi:GNAT family N-acetyltransferase [Streptomyces sp. NBC_00503]|uniref:GNAT family N-acetyltransferase n=1 Tax=Streptomyces sp. NBC_00503 TaxID=2903659 RepID=UPI002E81092A|nr:GNAT family N-acetyltransferase [Streptomyces sp. NBC_00503]WUD80115.1 GNAT family N-acetyltransferase [Streptomyces sp. NBC_00503]
MNTTIRVGRAARATGLVLRPWCEADGEALVEAHRDPAMRHWLTRHVDDAEDARRWLEEQRLNWESGDRLGFAVYEAAGSGEDLDAGSGSLAGNVVLKRAASRSGSAEVGYWTVASARGRGVASRALEAVTDWAFATFSADGPDRLDRLELMHQVDNLASCRVAEKAGYRLDRVLPAVPPYPLDGHLHVRGAKDSKLSAVSFGSCRT